jgi:hypothetical protein
VLVAHYRTASRERRVHHGLKRRRGAQFALAGTIGGAQLTRGPRGDREAEIAAGAS